MVWKKHLSILYSDSLNYCHFLAKVQIVISITTIIASVLGAYILPKISWSVGAIVTPLSMIVTGIPLFITVIYYNTLEYDLWYSILLLSVYLGAIQNILVRSAKYSFFEPTKEMAYIPLDEELKSKGKGVVDIVGERFGKASSSAVQWLMLSFISGSTLITLTPYLFIVFLIVMGAWMVLVFVLGKEMRIKANI
jgi:AAA family ATP:ADP antiporter